MPASILTPDTVQTRIGELKFFDGLPDEETVKKVYDQLDFARGVEAFLTGIPAGMESNWIQTVRGKGFYPMLRFYSPTAGLFDGTWKLSDIELLK